MAGGGDQGGAERVARLRGREGGKVRRKITEVGQRDICK